MFNKMFLKALFVSILFMSSQAYGQAKWPPGSEDCWSVVSGTSQCSQCSDGFALNRGKCETPYESIAEYQENFDRCDLFDYPTQTCGECKWKYQNMGGKCKEPGEQLRSESENDNQSTKQKNQSTESNEEPKETGSEEGIRPTEIVEQIANEEQIIGKIANWGDLYCNRFTRQGYCKKCSQGYTMQSGACTLGSNPSDHKTTESEDGQTIGTIGNWGDMNCNQFTRQGYCKKCSQGYTMQSGACTLGSNPSDHKTTESEDGQTIGTIGNWGDMNCNQFTRQGYCKKCSQGYTMQSGACTLGSNPSDHKTTESEDGQTIGTIGNWGDQHCNRFTRQGYCKKCSQGYTMQSGACTLGSNPSDHKTTESEDGQTIGTIGNWGDMNCNQFTRQGYCKKCSQGYTMQSGACTLGSNPSDHKTTESEDGQTIGTIGNWGDQHCNRFTRQGYCKKCSQGYTMQSGACTLGSNPSDHKTTESEDGQTIGTIGNWGDQHCNRFTRQGYCKKCSQGYTMQSGACTLGSNPSDHKTTESEDGQTIGTIGNWGDQHCNRFTRQGYCKKCSQGYTMQSGACTLGSSQGSSQGSSYSGQDIIELEESSSVGTIKWDPFCNTNNRDGYCIKCAWGHSMRSGTCTAD